MLRIVLLLPIAVLGLSAILWGLAGDLAPASEDARYASLSIADACLQRTENRPDLFDEEARNRSVARWIEVCREAARADDADVRLKKALARALGADGQREEAVALLRLLAAQDDAAAHYDIFEEYKSFGRTIGRPQWVSRAEAEQSLRRAAELGHSNATLFLAVLLDRGSVVRRDPAGARYWAERAVARPPRDQQVIDMQVLLGRLLVKSDRSGERTRGRDLLEILSSAGRGDAKAHLAKAIRPEDPVRARKLLEEAVRSFPGHAIVDLSDMLIRGEGGTKDEKRALSLLRSAPTIGSVSGALGQLYLEGDLVPRDIPKALSLIHHAAVWEYEARLQLMRLLAENPEVRLSHGDSVLYDMVEAVELEEPGALPALIELKLSNHVQFGDKAGGCVLLQRAAQQGLPGLDRWEPHCAVH